MSMPTPVTNSNQIADSGSSRNARIRTELNWLARMAHTRNTRIRPNPRIENLLERLPLMRAATVCVY